MSDDVEFDYDYLMQKALRNLMRDVLTMVAELGDAPGEHHFYIEFITGAPGVSIPDHLKAEYPDRMTIVLQHQFNDLTVTDEGFAVMLSFKSKEARLQIPFDAVTSFADPSVEFGLRFETVDVSKKPAEEEAPPEEESAEKPPGADDAEKKENNGDGADVVSLDAFRKK